MVLVNIRLAEISFTLRIFQVFVGFTRKRLLEFCFKLGAPIVQSKTWKFKLFIQEISIKNRGANKKISHIKRLSS